MKSLAASVSEGLLRYTSDGRKVLLHMTFSTYAADIPETKDLLSIESGIQTVMPYQMCEA